MKLIDYVCEKCGNKVEGWEPEYYYVGGRGCGKTSGMNEEIKKITCCGKIMTPRPWMNNQLPTCGEKG